MDHPYCILASIILAAPGNNQSSILNGVYNNADVNMDGIVRYAGTGTDRFVILGTVISNGGNASTVIVQQF